MRVSDRPTSILHRVNLESVGGVEISFEQFLRDADKTLTHQVLVNENIHPFFDSALKSSGARLYRRTQFKRWHGIPLPGFVPGLRNRITAGSLRVDHPDLVMAWNKLPNRELVNMARALSRPLIYYEHGSGWSGSRNKRREREVEAGLSAIRGAVCNSQASRRMLQLRWGYDAEPVLVYCAIGDSYEAAAPSRAFSPGGRVRIGITGRLVPMKGVSLALFMLEALNRDYGLDVELHVAGEGPEKTNLTNLATRLGLVDRVFSHGLVADMPAFYDSIDVQVVPSIQESFGRVSIEAQARGCPVVVAGVDGLPETLIDGESGIVVRPSLDLHSYFELGGNDDGLPSLIYDPVSDGLAEPKLADPADLAQAVHRIVGDRESYRRFSEVARTQARERFSQQRFVSRLHSALVDFAA